MPHSPQRIAILTLGVLALAACGDPPEPGQPGGTGGLPNTGGTGGRGVTSGDPNTDLGLRLHLTLPSIAETVANSAIGANGNVFGTFTDGGAWEASPTDRIIVRSASGETIFELVMNVTQYDPKNGVLQYSAQGSSVENGVTYSFNLSRARQDNGSSQNPDIEQQVQGTVTASGFSQTISKTLRFWGTGTVVNNDERWNHSWSAGGAQYVWNNARILTAINDDGPVDVDSYWVVDGVLTKDGSPVGWLEREDKGISQDIVLRTSNGAKETLLSFKHKNRD